MFPKSIAVPIVQNIAHHTRLFTVCLPRFFCIRIFVLMFMFMFMNHVMESIKTVKGSKHIWINLRSTKKVGQLLFYEFIQLVSFDPLIWLHCKTIAISHCTPTVPSILCITHADSRLRASQNYQNTKRKQKQRLNFDLSAYFNPSTSQPFNLSTFQPFNLSAFQPLSLSTFQPFSLSTF